MIENVTEKMDKFLEGKLDKLDKETDPDKEAKLASVVASLYKERVQYEAVKSNEAVAFKKSNTDFMIAQQQHDSGKADRIVNACVKGVELVAPLIFQGIWMGRVMQFEETGKACSEGFRFLWGRLGRK